MSTRIDTAPTRFWAKVQKTEGCWLWTGAKNGRGYGSLNYGKKVIGAHVLSHMLHHGPVPAGMQVMHSCDNPPCVNPAHLSFGTPSDNAKDAVKKGRHNPHYRNLKFCKHGHEYTPENTCVRANGTGRKCRACGRASAKNQKAKQRANHKARWIAVQFKKFRPFDLPKAA